MTAVLRFFFFGGGGGGGGGAYVPLNPPLRMWLNAIDIMVFPFYSN